MIEDIESEVISAVVTAPIGHCNGSVVKKKPRGLVTLLNWEHLTSSYLFSQTLASPHHPQSGEAPIQVAQSVFDPQDVWVSQLGPDNPGKQEHFPSQVHIWFDEQGVAQSAQEQSGRSLNPGLQLQTPHSHVPFPEQFPAQTVEQSQTLLGGTVEEGALVHPALQVHDPSQLQSPFPEHGPGSPSHFKHPQSASL